jgi:ribosome-associated translation inhibitor RaiA
MYASIDKVTDKLERQIRDGHGSRNKKGAERASDHLLPSEPEE